MILTFFKGLLRELWLLVKDPRGIFMFLVAPLLMNIVVCGAFQNGIVNHIPLAAVEMSSSAKTRELIRAFDESDRFDVTLVLQDLDEAKQKMEEGEVYGIIVIPADYTRSLQLGQQAEVLVGINSANNLVGQQCGCFRHAGRENRFLPDCRQKLCGIGQHRCGGYGEGHADFDCASPVV